MKVFTAVFLATVVGYITNDVNGAPNLKSFKWNSCGAEDDPIRMESWSISPDPILIPGTVTIAETLVADVDIVSPTKGSITIKYQPLTGGDWTEIPCVNGVGSCEYGDICAFLDVAYPPSEPCPAILQLKGYPCRCPFTAGTYTFQDAKIFFTEPLSINEGNYYAKTNLSTAERELACYELYLTIQSA